MAAKEDVSREPGLAPVHSPLSGTLGIDYVSHFMSYGVDVWGAGDEFYGSQDTVFAYGELGAELPAGFGLILGVWSDINNNAADSLGGNIQEIDVYGGLIYQAGDALLRVTYQEWYYGSETERVLDLSVGYDDSAYWATDFALNPSFVTHIRVDGQPGQDEGAVFVPGIEPTIPLTQGEVWPMTLAVPINGGFITDDYYGGDGGFAYLSTGPNLSIGLTGMPSEYGDWSQYGDWSLGLSTTYYNTQDDQIPTNPEDSFITSMVSLAVNF